MRVLSSGTVASWDGWTRLVKQSDTARASNTTAADDPELTITVPAGKYIVHMKVWYQTPAAADFKCTVNRTGASVWHHNNRIHTNASTQEFLGDSTTGPFTANAGVGSDSVGFVEIDARFECAGEATVAFMWAQNTSNVSNTTVLSGSYIEYRKL